MLVTNSGMGPTTVGTVTELEPVPVTKEPKIHLFPVFHQLCLCCDVPEIKFLCKQGRQKSFLSSALRPLLPAHHKTHFESHSGGELVPAGDVASLE